MRNLIKTIFLVLLLSQSVNCLFGQDNLTVYNYEKFNFSISFLQEPQYLIDTTYLDENPIYIYRWELNVDDESHENSYYSVSTSTYPSEFIHSDSSSVTIDGFLNSTQNDYINDKEYTLLSSSDIEINGYPGKIFKWKYSNSNVFFESRVFLVNSSLYEIFVLTKEEQNNNKYINLFLNSFELLNIPKGNYSIEIPIKKATYSIEFPDKYIDSTIIVNSQQYKIVTYIKLCEPKDKSINYLYLSSEAKFPKSIVDVNNKYELDNYYKKTIDATANSMNAKVSVINDISYKKYNGKEYKCYLSDGKVLMIGRLFYINDCLYVMAVMTKPDQENNKQLKKFFKTFKVL